MFFSLIFYSVPSPLGSNPARVMEPTFFLSALCPYKNKAGPEKWSTRSHYLKKAKHVPQDAAKNGAVTCRGALRSCRWSQLLHPGLADYVAARPRSMVTAHRGGRTTRPMPPDS